MKFCERPAPQSEKGYLPPREAPPAVRAVRLALIVLGITHQRGSRDADDRRCLGEIVGVSAIDEEPANSSPLVITAVADKCL